LLALSLMLTPLAGFAQPKPAPPPVPNAVSASTTAHAALSDKVASAADPVRQATAALMQWRQDWENRDFERFAAHHAAEFRVEGADRERFLERKRTIFERRPWQRIRLFEVLWIVDGTNPNRLTVQFVQSYESAILSERSRKEQRWGRVGDAWRLLSEQEIPLPDPAGAARRAAR